MRLVKSGTSSNLLSRSPLIWRTVGSPELSFTSRKNTLPPSRRLTMRPAIRTRGRSASGRSAGSAKTSAIGMRPSNRWPQGSTPSAAIRASLSARLAVRSSSGSVATAARAGWRGRECGSGVRADFSRASFCVNCDRNLVSASYLKRQETNGCDLTRQIQGRTLLDMKVSALIVSFLVTVAALADDPGRVMPPDQRPPDARVTAKPRDLDGYFPFTPPKARKACSARRQEVKTQLLVALGLWPMHERNPLEPIIHGRIDRDDYTIEKVYFASLPGHYVTGNLYRQKNGNGRHPAVL